MNGMRSRFNKTAFVIAAYITIGDGDAYIVNTGDNNMGKSTFGIRLAKRIAYYLRKYFSIDAHFIKKRDIWFVPNKHDIQELQRKDRMFQIKLIDDAYFLGMNLDFNLALAKETTRVAMGTRGKHNVVIMNFQRPSRAVKTLLERFKIMFFKPTQPDALLRCRDSLSVLNEDPWDLIPVLKASNPKERIRKLKRSQTYMTEMSYRNLKHKEFEAYKELQKDALERRRARQEQEEEITTDFHWLAEEVYKGLNKGTFAYTDIEVRLKNPKTYGFTDKQYKSFMRYYNKFESSRKIKKMKRKEDAGE